MSDFNIFHYLNVPNPPNRIIFALAVSPCVSELIMCKNCEIIKLSEIGHNVGPIWSRDFWPLSDKLGQSNRSQRIWHRLPTSMRLSPTKPEAPVFHPKSEKYINSEILSLKFLVIWSLHHKIIIFSLE